MRQVSARAWCRVDFAGGTLDIWPLGLLHPGALTVNSAIDLAAEVTLRPRAAGYRLITDEIEELAKHPEDWIESPETTLFGHLAIAMALPPMEIAVRSGSPRGGGLGASSAIAMAFIAAAERIVGGDLGGVEGQSRLARDVEARMMRLPTGRQDHLPAALGGVLVIRHEPGGERIERLDVDLAALGDSLIVAYSGQSHFSAGSNWSIVRSRLDGDAATVEHFAQIARIAVEVADSLRAGDLRLVGALMSEEWSHRRALAAGISTPRIESMLEAAVGAGAWGGKACGAGGGGCVVVLAPEHIRDQVASALSAESEVLQVSPCAHPLEVRVE